MKHFFAIKSNTKRRTPIACFILSTLIFFSMLFDPVEGQQIQQRNTADSNTDQSSARSRELADQLRRSRSGQRSQRRSQEGREGLLTMNLTGLETFGDALGSTLDTSGNSYTKTESIVLGSGMFLNSQISNGGGMFRANIASTAGAPSFSLALSQSTPFQTGTNQLAITQVSGMLTGDVVSYLGQKGGGTGGTFDISASQELIDYAATYGIDSSELHLNPNQSYVRFNNPASGNYQHAADFQDGQIAYDYYARYEIPIQPGGGGIYGLGRQKITENMTPIPTDRFIFDYSYFHGVPLSYGKMGVNRLTPGFEKTFLNKRFSLEMRLPFATTIDNDLHTDNSTELNVLQLGDMTMILKYLLLRRERFAMTVGLAWSVPLADDMRLFDTVSGNELIRWENETCHIMPYVGMLYMPTDRLFMQACFQIDAAACGDPTYVANISDPSGQMIRVGKTYDRTFSYTSLSIGYWLRRQIRHNILQKGLNLIGELHWTQSLDRADGVFYEQDGHTFNIGESRGNYSVLNLTLGSRIQLNPKLNIGLGYSVPLSNGSQKQFDGEFRLTCNRYF